MKPAEFTELKISDIIAKSPIIRGKAGLRLVTFSSNFLFHITGHYTNQGGGKYKNHYKKTKKDYMTLKNTL